LTDHLPDRGILAADGFDIAHRQLLEGNDVGVQLDTSKAAPKRANRQDLQP
jgi:hypothetical protein